MTELSDVALLPVGPNPKITLNFSFSLADGSIVESTVDGDPATFVSGDGSLLPGFEEALMG
jgi:FKBP-type peptidyl-prolyl cis-trans isomerase SlpA